MSDHELAQRYETAVMLFQKHITRAEDGTFRFDVEDGKSIGVDDPVLFANLKRSVEETNRKIKQGEIDPRKVEYVFY